VLNSTAMAVFPFLFPIWLALRQEPGSLLLPALLLACLGSILWYTAHGLELRRHHVPLIYLALIPLSMLLIAIVNLEGVIRRVAGRRIWKDRRI